MNPPASRIELPGSARTALPHAQAGTPTPPQERLQVTVRLRAGADLSEAATGGQLADCPPQDRTYLSREELEQQFAASPADINQVVHFAQAHGLAVVHASAAERSVQLAGTAAAFAGAFGTSLREYHTPEGTYRGRVGALSVPAELGSIVEGVFGLDNRPQAKPHFQRLPQPGIAHPHAVNQSYTPLQLARLYDFPAGPTGAKQCIGIVELGGGFRPADLAAYFKRLGLVGVPTVQVVRIDGATNHPTTADSADGEVLLDIEVAAAVAPQAQVVVYFAPNTSQGFLNAITAALHDKVHRPTVLSISWGSAESSWTTQALDQFNQAFQTAALLGITVCVAAGDNGSGDGVRDGQPHVDFPASSPFVLACGGTNLVGQGTTISREVVWNAGPDSATGGGVSAHFAAPTYQADLALRPGGPPLAGRGVPDVAGDADPATGYQVRIDGVDTVIGGTSAVAPLWAGLLALFNQQLPKPVGFLNPLLYGSLRGQGVRDVTSGSNGAFTARVGWDACTGWGSPAGAALLRALRGLSSQPTPRV
ncbi:S8 family serine peptidase [Hymenobacter sp. HMF4947]|uniref:S8 family serine peptidase n=1 Tax=Hymenobacter ginkgonis TaxID=2682976 RepID=A0A7K1T8I7_9BACT|nr:S53 family peptidase [Hymenobacter ginkgonis]MVN74715.1 S8 family serine peptidase [Hymenobacter ginkgonis]